MRIVSAGHDDELGTENFSLVDIRPEDIPEPNRAFVLFVRSTGNPGISEWTKNSPVSSISSSSDRESAAASTS